MRLAGSGDGRREDSRGDALPQHDRSARAACLHGCSPIIRPTIPGHCRQHRRWTRSMERRRGDRNQPGVRQSRRRWRLCCACSTGFARRYAIPTQSCVLAHVTTQMEAMRRGAPVDLVFQSIAGTEAANRSFGVTLAMLEEAREQALALQRGTVGDNVMYFETGQGSALSAECASRRGSANLRSARLRGGPPFRTAAGEHRGRASSVPSICTTASRFCGPRSKTISAASCWACRWAATSATPITPKPTRTTWTRCSRMLGAAGVNYIMGVPGRRRHHAELPEHVFPRCAVSAEAA